MINQERARWLVNEINFRASEMGTFLLELRDEEGWKVLGYKNWTECLRDEFSFSRNHLYELMKAAPIQERLSPAGYNISVGQAVALAKYPEYLQPAIVEIVVTRYSTITESRIERVGSVLTQAAVTGFVNTGDGDNATGLEAALTLEDHEAMLKQKQHIADASSRKLVGKATVAGQHLLNIGVDLDGLEYDKSYQISIYEQIEESEAVPS